MERTSEPSEDGGWYNRLPQSDGFLLLLDVVLEGQTLLVTAELGRAAVLVKAVEGRDALGVGQRGLAVPPVESGEAVHTVLGTLLLKGDCKINTTESETLGTFNNALKRCNI